MKQSKVTGRKSQVGGYPAPPEIDDAAAVDREAVERKAEEIIEDGWLDLATFVERNGGKRLEAIFRVLRRREGADLAAYLRELPDDELGVVAAFARQAIAETCLRCSVRDADAELGGE